MIPALYPLGLKEVFESIEQDPSATSRLIKIGYANLSYTYELLSRLKESQLPPIDVEKVYKNGLKDALPESEATMALTQNQAIDVFKATSHYATIYEAEISRKKNYLNQNQFDFALKEHEATLKSKVYRRKRTVSDEFKSRPNPVMVTSTNQALSGSALSPWVTVDPPLPVQVDADEAENIVALGAGVVDDFESADQFDHVFSESDHDAASVSARQEVEHAETSGLRGPSDAVGDDGATTQTELPCPSGPSWAAEFDTIGDAAVFDDHAASSVSVSSSGSELPPARLHAQAASLWSSQPARPIPQPRAVSGRQAGSSHVIKLPTPFQRARPTNWLKQPISSKLAQPVSTMPTSLNVGCLIPTAPKPTGHLSASYPYSLAVKSKYSGPLPEPQDVRLVTYSKAAWETFELNEAIMNDPAVVFVRDGMKECAHFIKKIAGRLGQTSSISVIIGLALHYGGAKDTSYKVEALGPEIWWPYFLAFHGISGVSFKEAGRQLPMIALDYAAGCSELCLTGRIQFALRTIGHDLQVSVEGTSTVRAAAELIKPMLQAEPIVASKLQPAFVMILIVTAFKKRGLPTSYEKVLGHEPKQFVQKLLEQAEHSDARADASMLVNLFALVYKSEEKGSNPRAGALALAREALVAGLISFAASAVQSAQVSDESEHEEIPFVVPIEPSAPEAKKRGRPPKQPSPIMPVVQPALQSAVPQVVDQSMSQVADPITAATQSDTQPAIESPGLASQSDATNLEHPAEAVLGPGSQSPGPPPSKRPKSQGPKASKTRSSGATQNHVIEQAHRRSTRPVRR